MANFSQLRRRQSSREMLYRKQYSFELEMEEKSRNDPEAGMQLRRRHPTISGRPTTGRSLKRQISAAPDPDEMGEIMWEMRPRYYTSAGELKRKIRKERKAERDRQEVRVSEWYITLTPCVWVEPLLVQ